MSTFIAAVQAVILPISIMTLSQFALALAVLAILALFRPLLRGIARVLLLAVRPKQSKEAILLKNQMRDAQMLKRMLNAMEGCPSHAAELRALAARA